MYIAYSLPLAATGGIGVVKPEAQAPWKLWSLVDARRAAPNRKISNWSPELSKIRAGFIIQGLSCAGLGLGLLTWPGRDS